MSNSRLFNLEPVGIGTPYVESLPSYIKRLADAHSVLPDTLMDNEIYPEIFPTGHKEMALNNWSRRPRSLDFIKRVIQVLEIKTSNPNIRNLSLLKFGTDIYSRFVFRKYAAWCPICYEESKASNGVIYEPLIWSIEDVLICKKHSVKLHTSCPNCNTNIKRYEPKAKPGYCSCCKTWLGSEYAENKDDFSVLAHDQIGKIISKLPSFDYTDIWDIKLSFEYLKKINELVSMEKNFTALKNTVDEICSEKAEG